MRKAAHPLLLGAFIGILTLLFTYIIGAIHHGFYLAIVKLEWLIMCLSIIPALLFLTVATFRFNKNIKHILVSSITSGIVFMICGWFVLGYKQPIIKMVYYFFPTDVHYIMVGYPSNSYIFNAGIFLVAIVFSHLIVTQKIRGSK